MQKYSFSATLKPRSWLKYRVAKSVTHIATSKIPVLTPPFRIQLQHQYNTITLRGGRTYAPINSDHEHDDDDEDVDANDDELNGSLQGMVIPPYVTETWKQTPPVTRTFLAVSLLCTVLANIFNNNEFPQIFEMNMSDVVQKLQVIGSICSCVPVG